jgi:orotidine-5'-phosphate decarboxylase
VLGLDPDPLRLWPEAMAAAAADPAGAVADHCRAVIDAVADAVVAVKPQVACFERLGAAGWAALAATVRHARDAGLVVLADAKRGDIDVSATAYAQGILGATPTPGAPVPGLGADAMTVAPYMGLDTLRSFANVARPAAAGLFVLVRTSNPGAADLQHLPAPTRPLYLEVAELAERVNQAGNVGLVVGATAPEQVAEVRGQTSLPFLVPGVGAQGGDLEGSVRAAWNGDPASCLISTSRAVLYADDPAQAADGLRQAINRVLETTAMPL